MNLRNTGGGGQKCGRHIWKPPNLRNLPSAMVRRLCNTHVDELVEVWYPLDGVADDEDDGDGEADLGQSDLFLPRRAPRTVVARRGGRARVATLALKVVKGGFHI